MLSSPSDIRGDLLAALDPVRLARAAGLEPDPWQAKMLRSSSPRLLLNCCRQSGKSTTTGVLACHTALYDPGSLTLLLSPSLRQSGELFKKVQGVYHAAGDPVPLRSETALTLTLMNGSRVVSLPGTEGTVRGYSGATLIVIDESSRVDEELYFGIRPMLAVSGGRLAALSTPFGTRGWWYEAWRSQEAWERYEVTAAQCPRITPEFLAEEREAMGDWWYQQEYFARFLDAQSSAFATADIEAAFDEEVETWTL